MLNLEGERVLWLEANRAQLMHMHTQLPTETNLNQRSLRDSTISHGVCVGEMLVLKAICDALTH